MIKSYCDLSAVINKKSDLHLYRFCHGHFDSLFFSDYYATELKDNSLKTFFCHLNEHEKKFIELLAKKQKKIDGNVLNFSKNWYQFYWDTDMGDTIFSIFDVVKSRNNFSAFDLGISFDNGCMPLELQLKLMWFKGKYPIINKSSSDAFNLARIYLQHFSSGIDNFNPEVFDISWVRQDSSLQYSEDFFRQVFEVSCKDEVILILNPRTAGAIRNVVDINEENLIIINADYFDSGRNFKEYYLNYCSLVSNISKNGGYPIVISTASIVGVACDWKYRSSIDFSAQTPYFFFDWGQALDSVLLAKLGDGKSIEKFDIESKQWLSNLVNKVQIDNLENEIQNQIQYLDKIKKYCYR